MEAVGVRNGIQNEISIGDVLNYCNADQQGEQTQKSDTFMNGITHIEPSVRMVFWAVALFLLTFVVTLFY